MSPRLGWCLLALVAASACKRDGAQTQDRRPPPALAGVSAFDLSPATAEGPLLDVDALSSGLRARLLQTRLFSGSLPDAGASPHVRVRAELAVEEVRAGDKAAARATVRLRIDGRPQAEVPARWNEDVQAGSEMPFDPASDVDRKAVFQRLASRTLADLAAGYVARQTLWADDGASLKAALQADAGDLRIEALRVMGERKLRTEIPSALRLLDDEDEQVRDAALGALVELREPKAVAVLARQRSMKDKREMRKVLEAMAVIGGDEAANYLGFIAEGHEDEEIRQMAADAKKRLQRKQGAK